ncbi:PHP domain-containing protein [Kribbella qitaiheensis]|uniref:PHP domain-containing protein n=1 Tax=Kribbella qitaiheensis TaxID=1544730 RepID=A0A7G6WWM8_9ACTN|nr:PHP domain-containing protein [Kribbella qitaiheensis]QNE18393.1 PHP domain-containing protein [Kribbella qitaiheensis]
MRIDLHTHSNRSDGTDPVDVLIAQAKRDGLDVIALTDHDTADGWAEGRRAAEDLAVGFVPGIEISCKLNGISVHLLAYLLDPSYEPLAVELATVRDGRTDRIPSIVGRINAMGVELTVDEVLAQATGTPSVGRPHVADALVAKGVVADRGEAFDRFLADGRPGHVSHYAIDPGRAIDLVREAGGVPVIAHPWGRSSYKVITEETIARFVDEHGLAGIEVDHQDHSAASRTALRGIAQNLGIIYTGSSDHHGAGKINHELGVNSTEPEQFQALLEVAKTNAAASEATVPEAYLP